ncbi:hypothetical protein ACLOJK_035786 [Asimina triloba]
MHFYPKSKIGGESGIIKRNVEGKWFKERQMKLPSRFNLPYSAEDEAKRERPVMIHRAILGSVEPPIKPLFVQCERSLSHMPYSGRERVVGYGEVQFLLLPSLEHHLDPSIL